MKKNKTVCFWFKEISERKNSFLLWCLQIVKKLNQPDWTASVAILRRYDFWLFQRKYCRHFGQGAEDKLFGYRQRSPVTEKYTFLCYKHTFALVTIIGEFTIYTKKFNTKTLNICRCNLFTYMLGFFLSTFFVNKIVFLFIGFFCFPYELWTLIWSDNELRISTVGP